MINRGFFEIGIYSPQKECNWGTLMRSAYQLGASGAFLINRKFKHQSGDTCKSYKHMPVRSYENWEQFLDNRPHGAELVAVESPDYGGGYLKKFDHPDRAIYLLGSESSGLPPYIVEQCQHVVSIESIRTYSFNVSVAGSIVMWDRIAKS